MQVSIGVHVRLVHKEDFRRARRCFPLKAVQLHSETKLYLGLMHHTDGVEGTWRRMGRRRPTMCFDCGPAQAYLRRCTDLAAHPPVCDWNGVYVMQTK